MTINYLDTGDTGHAVSSESDGALFAGIFGAEKYVLENGSQLKAEVQSNNIVKISDGDAVMYGRHVRIQSNDSALVTINNGHSGTNRIDLIVFRYTKDSTGKETVDLVVIQGEDSTGTPTAPTAVNGNILTGAMKSDFPLYSVELNGINIVKVNPLFNVIGNISKLTEELTKLNSKMTETIKEIKLVSKTCTATGTTGELGSYYSTINLTDIPENCVAVLPIGATKIGTPGYPALLAPYKWEILSLKCTVWNVISSQDGKYGACFAYLLK